MSCWLGEGRYYQGQQLAKHSHTLRQGCSSAYQIGALKRGTVTIRQGLMLLAQDTARHGIGRLSDQSEAFATRVMLWPGSFVCVRGFVPFATQPGDEKRKLLGAEPIGGRILRMGCKRWHAVVLFAIEPVAGRVADERGQPNARRITREIGRTT